MILPVTKTIVNTAAERKKVEFIRRLISLHSCYSDLISEFDFIGLME